ncbi:MDR family NADP-dependent oxidoreductase [Bradyrhizobium manausense]|uniref:MDR family NADP-dependent oxidoreductase n=1 Tax=Bradyrhizobium manausense TaxID=989370 RepID=UPI001BA4E00B|nr:NADP-dependent oxidoreductase [Bradyrhizobium manausense]MBR0725570.1 NADP-dependent oxidoreductase [Bradyrhizobium manausense]
MNMEAGTSKMVSNATGVNRQWLLARRPVGAVKTDDFRLTEGEIPTPGAGDILVRTLYFGFDASQRIWLTDDGGYMPPIMPGDPMRCMGIGQVVRSNDANYRPGDLVEGFMSWQDYVIVRSDGPMPLRCLPKADYPISWNLGVFGVGGLTAYFGIVDGLKVKGGETVVVSAATGATGSLAGQIAKAMGAKKVIGTAGGPEKCKWVVEHAGYDAAIDYKNGDLSAQLSKLCPEGVDAYFDNVGGDMLDTLFLHMAPKGRILICGAMSSGYTDVKLQGPRNYMRICTHQLTMQGILLFFYRDQIAEGAARLGQWVMEGKLLVEEDMHEGFEKAPSLLPTMFTGKAPGKLILHVADPA